MIAQELKEGVEYLQGHGVINPKNECELLLMHILNKGRADIYFDDGQIDAQARWSFQEAVIKRAKGFPLQYITGVAHFLEFELKVNEDVLIPRPETEILVEELAKRIKGVKDPLIIDIGTGSGNIAIGLTKRVPECRIFATDISRKALETAEHNALKYGARNIRFLHSDLLEKVPEQALRSADVLVSNPPYISRLEYDQLPREVYKEPKVALFGGEDGLEFYRKISREAAAKLKKGAIMCFEVPDSKAGQVLEILKNSGDFCKEEMIPDNNNIPRVVFARKN